MPLGNVLPQILMLGGMALACFLLLRGTWRYLAANARAKKSANPADEIRRLLGNTVREQPLIDAPDQVLQWQVELHEIVREAKAEIDTKLLALQHLLGEIHSAEERLRRLLARAELQPSAAAPLLDEIDRLVSSAGEKQQDLFSRLHAQTEPAALGRLNARQQQAAAALYAQGVSPAEISRQLQLSLGDAELLASLSPAPHTSS